MTEADDPDRGSAVLAVMMFAGLAVLSLTVLAGGVVAEYRAVEDSLAQTRAYWAAMGQATYVLSRTRKDGSTRPKNDGLDTPIKVACTYLNEIGTKLPADPDDDKPCTNDNATFIAEPMTWLYPNLGPGYRFVVSPVMRQGAKSGAITIEFAFTTSAGAPEALRAIPVTRPVRFSYCLVPVQGQTCGYVPREQDKDNLQNITGVQRPKR